MFRFCILYSFVVLIACNTNIEKVSDTAISKDSTTFEHYRTIASDYSTGSNYIAILLKVADTDSAIRVVVPTEYLHRITLRYYHSEDDYLINVTRALVQDSPLIVNDKVFSMLEVNEVEDDSELFQVANKGLHIFVDSFFTKKSDNLYYSCFPESKMQNKVIFILIKMFSIFPKKDDESGCVVIIDSALKG